MSTLTMDTNLAAHDESVQCVQIQFLGPGEKVFVWCPNPRKGRTHVAGETASTLCPTCSGVTISQAFPVMTKHKVTMEKVEDILMAHLLICILL